MSPACDLNLGENLKQNVQILGLFSCIMENPAVHVAMCLLISQSSAEETGSGQRQEQRPEEYRAMHKKVLQ